MKKNQYVFVLASILLLIICNACNKSIYTGLIAFYPFSGDATDQSGKGNDCIVEGATLTSDRFGNEKSAFSFDGAGNTILANMKNMPSIDSPISFSWWFYNEKLPVFTTSSGAQNMIVVVNRDEGIGVQAGFRSPGYGTLGFDTWNWGGGTLLQVSTPEAKKWYHCVYSFDGSTHHFYLNAKEITRSNEKTQKGTPTVLMLGNYPSGKQYFEGKLDEVCIYNRALTVSEIELLYKKIDPFKDFR